MNPNTDRRYPIPVLFNLATALVCSTLYFVVLYATSRAASLAGVMCYGFLFAVIMIPIYSLIHEAEHNMLLPPDQCVPRKGSIADSPAQAGHCASLFVP